MSGDEGLDEFGRLIEDADKAREERRKRWQQTASDTKDREAREQGEREKRKSRSPRRGDRSRSRSRSRSRGRGRRSRSRGRDRECGRESRMTREEAEKLAAMKSQLPIVEYKDEILQLLLDNQIIIVVGETGSGKSTQLPQFILDDETLRKQLGLREKDKVRVAVTQPRRVAAVAMARRVSYERGSDLGRQVGYRIRFDDKSSRDTQICYVTDGCLMRECLSDPDLKKYNVIVLDEAHERSLHTDVLFALVKNLLTKRTRDLRVLVTSATLDKGKFQNYFNNCPLLSVPGRSFAVKIFYNPVTKGKRLEACVNAALKLHMKEGPGHILCFLTGKEECESGVAQAQSKMMELMNAGHELGDCMFYPLYGGLTTEDQRQVFEEVDEDCRKIIFCTNIAETSLTVNGVGFVIDSGYVKQKEHNAKTGMDSLVVSEISKTQAVQRSGRAGRTQDGKCFRLYAEDTFVRTMEEETPPEILRSSLASVVLQLKELGIHNVVKFDFMDKPNTAALLQALKVLYLLDAIDDDGNITRTGKTMVQMPLEPTYAKCVLASAELGCLHEVTRLVSMLSTETVWFRPSKQKEELLEKANYAQAQFADKTGDHCTLLRVFNQFEEQPFRGRDQWCRENFIHQRSMRQADDIRKQLMEQVEKLKLPMGEYSRKGIKDPEISKKVRQAICAGFFMNAARRLSSGDGWLTVVDSVPVQADQWSPLAESNSPWIVYTELSGTSARIGIMRAGSEVDDSWIRPKLPKLASVDLHRLAGLEDEKAAKKRKRIEKEQQDAAAHQANRDDAKDRANSARERYLARKSGGKKR